MSAGANRYCTRDVISDPPTSVMIVKDVPSAPSTDLYFVKETDIEITEGWSTRFGKSQLSVCFMHSFGKCAGRCNNDPSTCHQIHIRRPVLDALRATYKNRTRSLFCRTVKAHLGEDIRMELSRIARKELTLKYLEYRAQDIEDTAGLQAYEASYRSWLFSAPGAPDYHHETCVFQCPSFAMTGVCESGIQCQHVHGDVRNAQVRDHVVANSLRQLAALAPPIGHTHHHAHPAMRHAPPPPPFAFPSPTMVPPQFSPITSFGNVAQQPMYVILMPSSNPFDVMHPQQMLIPAAGMTPVMAPPAFSPQTCAPASLKTASSGERSPECLSVTSDRTGAESTELPQTTNLWSDDFNVARIGSGEDIFQAFRTQFAGNGAV